MAVTGLSIRGTFSSLRNQHYRWLWLGGLASSGTFQLNSVAQGWIVYHLTGSAFALSWVSAGWSLSSLTLSLYGGAICDRVEKRTLMLWTRVAMLINSVIIGLLISLDVIQVWHLAASSLFTGMLFAFLMPASQAIVAELVDKETLVNAVSLSNVGMGLMGIICASIAGVLIESAGAAGVYYLMAGFYVCAIYTTVRLPKTRVCTTSTRSVWGDLLDGVRYLRFQPMLVAVLGLALVRVIFVMPYRTLLPAFARDNLNLGAAGLGWLSSATSVGTVTTSLLICALGDFPNKGRWLLWGGILTGVVMILFVGVPWVPAAFVFIALVGAGNSICMVMNNALLQKRSDPAYRGRVMSVYMMLWGLTPLGTLPGGAIADMVGVGWVVAGQGLSVIVLFALARWLKPEIRALD
jgi:MFS family permease